MVRYRSLDSLTEELDRIIGIFKKNPNMAFKSEYSLNKTTLKNTLRDTFNEDILKFTDPVNKLIVNAKVANFKKSYSIL